MEKITITIPSHMVESARKLITKAGKNINGLSCEFGKEYNKTFRHYCDGGFVKNMHKVTDMVVCVPDENDWYLIATIVDGCLFVANRREKIDFRNGHGEKYNLCDACKHRQKKKSFIVRNRKTDEELQIGSECAKKYGIGTMNAIYKLTNELYESYSLPYYEGEELAEWPPRIKDMYSVKSIETSIVVQAAKKYYDDHNGVWRKGYYSGRVYFKSESAIDIRSSLDDFEANDNDEYYKSLCDWIRSEFNLESCYSEFDEKIQSVGYDYYMSVADVAAAFFAIKRFEQYKKEKEAKEKGIYIPKRNDYIRIIGNVVNKKVMTGYYGEYTEYEVYNTIDNNTYFRAGVLPLNADGLVDGYAYVSDVFKGNYVLSRVTKGRKKNEELVNVNIKSA